VRRSSIERPSLFVVASDLLNYASDHGGSFPDDPDPYAALAKLFPAYTASGSELADFREIHAL